MSKRFFLTFVSNGKHSKIRWFCEKLEKTLRVLSEEKSKAYQTFFFRDFDLRYLKEFFLNFNKTIYTLNGLSFSDIKNEFDNYYKKFKLFEWSLLDFLMVYVDKLGPDNLI